MTLKGYGFKTYQNADEQVKAYKARLSRADKKFDETKQDVYDDIARYRMERRAKNESGTHNVEPPVAVGVIDSMYSSLTAVDVDPTVNPRGNTPRERADLAQQALTEEVEAVKLPRKVRKVVKDALLSRIGYLKVDYEYAEADVTRARSAEDINADIDQLFSAASAAGQLPPDPNEVAAVVPVQETVREAVRDRLVVDFIPWDMVRRDPDAKLWEDVRWIAFYTKLSVTEVQGNPAFREFCKDKGYIRKLDALKPDSDLMDRKERDIGAAPDPEDERVTIVELWDFETGTACAFPRYSSFILNERANPFAVREDIEDRNPFVRLVTREDPQRVEGISEMDVIKADVDELKEYRSNFATHVSRSVAKIAGPADAMTENGKAALKSREWGAFVELAQGHQANELQPLNPPELPREAFGYPDTIQQEIRDATGSSELMRGLFPDRKRTATETNAVVDSSSARQSEKRNALAEFYHDIFTRMLYLMAHMYTSDRISKMVEAEGDVDWSWGAEDVPLEIQVDVVLSPQEPDTRQVKADRAMAVLNLVMPLAGANIIDPAAVLTWALKEQGLRVEDIRTFILQPHEQQQGQMAQLQQQAEQQAVANGNTPNPANVPGPQSGQDLAAATNPGEIPPAIAAALAGGGQVRPVTPGDVAGPYGP